MRSVTFAVLLAVLVSGPARAGSARSAGYALELIDEVGRRLPSFEHRGRSYVLGSTGERYLLRVRSSSGHRVEVVLSVDGRDVIDGEPASWGKRGYILEPYGELTVEGFRLNQSSVAAFRFSSVRRSYAAQSGDARDVGVIGVAVFPERPKSYSMWRPAPPPERADPHGRETRPRSEPAANGPAGRAAGDQEAASAPAPSKAPGPIDQKEARRQSQRPGLGTEFAEEHWSEVQTTEFERDSAQPAVTLALRYNDRAGLLALGIQVDGHTRRVDDAWLRETAQPFRRDPGYSLPPPGWRPWR